MRAALTRRLVALAIALALVASLGTASTLAASISVNSLADTAAEDGLCTLREAITSANTDTASGASAGECAAGSGADDIGFSAAGTITLTAAPTPIESDLSVMGGDAVTVSGASLFQVFLISAGTVTLSGLIITAGMAAEPATFGGGISNSGTLTITNSTVVGNSAVVGGLGGIFNSGGGIFNTGTLTVANSTIEVNSAFGGGGIFNTGSLNVTNSTFSRNSGDMFLGGGIRNDATGTVTITSSTFSRNGAFEGGGVANSGGMLTVTNSTFSENSAAVGGGIDNLSGTLTITNSTISGNSVRGSGGGIVASGTDTLVNAIIAGNSASTGPDILGVAETITTSVIGVPAGKTLADILDPAGLADNGGPTQTIALALVAGNPAIDTAAAATCAAPPVSSLDQRGLPRPAACDIGAYEAQPPLVAPHDNVSAAATSPAGALVTYTPPAGTDEQGGAAAVACLPASGSTFAPGTTTVTCTATDAVGHTATGTFQVSVGDFVPPTSASPGPTASLARLPNTSLATGTNEMPGLPLALGLLSLAALVRITPSRARRN